MGMGPLIPRKHRAQFERFLSHKDSRIRAVAREMADLDAQTRAEWNEMRRQERALEETMRETWGDIDDFELFVEFYDGLDADALDDEEMPF